MSWITRKLGLERSITYATGTNAGLIQQPGYSGMVVTEQTSLGLSALWCGLKVISEAVGSLPPTLYKKQGTQLEKAENHPLYQLLYSEPNVEVTRPVLWETAQYHALLYGNAYLEIERDNAGRPIALWNIHPLYVQVARDTDTGKLVYRVTNNVAGGPPGQPGSVSILQAENVLHVPGLSANGSVGWSLLQTARDTLGFGLAAQRFGCSLFRNAGRPAGVIDVPPSVKLSEDGEQNLRRSFTHDNGGENVGSVAVMQQGFKFTPINLSTNEQLQYKELLQFFVYEVARLLNCPASKLQSLEKASWGNLETLNRDFLDTTLRPWLEKWEAELEKKLLMPSEKNKFFIEFDTAELLRADKLTRYQTYSTALAGAPFRTINEVRADENLPPIEGGEVLPSAPVAAPTTDKETDSPTDDEADDTTAQDSAPDNSEDTADE